MAEQHIGKVVEITGPVVVVAFEGEQLPPSITPCGLLPRALMFRNPLRSSRRWNSTWAKGA